MFNYTTLHPAYSRAFITLKRLDIDDGVKQELINQFGAMISKTWAILDEHLENRDYVATENQPSIVDYLIAVYARLAGTNSSRRQI